MALLTDQRIVSPGNLATASTTGTSTPLVIEGGKIKAADDTFAAIIALLAGPGGGGSGPWTFHSGAPNDQNGSDGDIYCDSDNGNIYQKGGGAWGSPVANFTGAAGADGAKILTGSGAPGAGAGANGDIYIDLDVWKFYGPKADGAWGSDKGTLKGADGVKWHQGSGAPGAGTGANGDFYLNASNGDIYGPKGGGAWGSKVMTIAGGGGAPAGAYAAVVTVAADITITDSNVGNLMVVADSRTLTLDEAGWSEAEFVDIVNITADKTATIAAGDGINDSATTTVPLRPRTLVRVTRAGNSAPYWRAGFEPTITLNENEAAVAMDDGTDAVEGRPQIVAWDLRNASVDANDTYELGEWYQPWTGRITGWRVATIAGTCDAVIRYNGDPAPGFGTGAVSLSTTPQTVTDDSVDLDNHGVVTVDTTNQSGLGGLRVWAIVMRTGP